MNRKSYFLKGVRDGLPIGIGYFTVAFALGITASNAGLAVWQSTLMSITNLTSAGEAEAIALLAVGTTYIELAITQLVINIRYLLMSCSLTQKLPSSTPIRHRLLMGFGVTDEIFGISSALEGGLSPYYSYGAMSVAIPGWTLGTLFGAVMGNVLPLRAVSALGVALYAMFLAIVLPPARKSRAIAIVVTVSAASSAALTLLCEVLSVEWFTEGFRIIFLTVLIAAIAAIVAPVKEHNSEEGAK